MDTPSVCKPLAPFSTSVQPAMKPTAPLCEKIDTFDRVATKITQSIPPRFSYKTHPATRLEPVAKFLMECLLVLTWPLKQIKHGLMWLANRQSRNDVLRGELYAAHQLIAVDKTFEGIQADIARLRATHGQMQSSVDALRQEAKNLETSLRRGKQEVIEFEDLSGRQAQLASELQQTISALTSCKIEIVELDLEKTRQAQLVSELQHTAASLKSVKSEIAALHLEKGRLEGLNARARYNAPQLASQNRMLREELGAAKKLLDGEKRSGLPSSVARFTSTRVPSTSVTYSSAHRQ